MGSAQTDARSFVRHPADIPIEIDADDAARRAARRLKVKDVSLGGLACRSQRSLKVGSGVVVTIPLVRPPFSAPGSVVWCRRAGPHYEVGIRFIAFDDAFAARMVEQVCHIEQYRNDVLRREGRELDGEAAALEWISRYAADFPAADGGLSH